MKKVISILLTLTVIICSVSFTVPAYAATKSIKSVINSSKTWCEVGIKNMGVLTSYKFGKNNKVTIIYSDLEKTTKKTVKYKISKNKIKFSYNMNSYKLKSTISTINGSNLLKATTITDDVKDVELLDKGSFRQRADTEVVTNFENSSWNAPSIKKEYPAAQKLIVEPFEDTSTNAYLDIPNRHINFYCVTNTVNTIKMQSKNLQDTYIIEKTSSPNKMKVFIFKNGGNKYATETWTKAK